MTPLQSLRARVEACTGPDREADVLIAAVDPDLSVVGQFEIGPLACGRIGGYPEPMIKATKLPRDPNQLAKRIADLATTDDAPRGAKPGSPTPPARAGVRRPAQGPTRKPSQSD